MIRQRHPAVTDRFVASLEDGIRMGSAVDAARHILGVQGFVPPSWTELSFGACPPPRAKNGLAKNGLAKIGLIGLAKIGLSQNWPGQKQVDQNWIGQNCPNQEAKNGLAKVGLFRGEVVGRPSH